MNLTRRSALKSLGATAARLAVALPLAPALPPASAWAQGDAPHLDVKDPAAAALGYVEHTSQIDRQKHPEYVPDTNCENCLQLQGKAGDNYRPCSLFPGKLVSVSGWCKGWTAEM